MNVYVIASEGGMCKIGKANDPTKRLRELSTGHPYRLTLACVFPLGSDTEAYAIEQSAHSVLASKRMIGEWFSVTPTHAADVIGKLINPKLAIPPEPEIDLQDWRVDRVANFIQRLADQQIALTAILRTRRCSLTKAAEIGEAVVRAAELADFVMAADDDL